MKMKTVWGVTVVLAGIVLLGGAAVAQVGSGQPGSPCPGMMGPGMGHMGTGMAHMGPGMGQMGPGMAHMGPGMGQMGPGMDHSGTAQLTEDRAKELAQQYANSYLQGFTVDKVLPFTGMGGMTMYSVELKGPKEEMRVLHVNARGDVMPFGGPWRRSG